MSRGRFWLWGIALAAGTLLASDALAFGPWDLGWGDLGWGYGGYGPYSAGYDHRRPPYFSLYPPVYYSHEIQRRPYGASPFAWVDGPGVATGGAGRSPAAISPACVVNPHVMAGRAAPASEESLPAPRKNAGSIGVPTSSESPPQGELIVNPYVGTRSRVAGRP